MIGLREVEIRPEIVRAGAHAGRLCHPAADLLEAPLAFGKLLFDQSYPLRTHLVRHRHRIVTAHFGLLVRLLETVTSPSAVAGNLAANRPGIALQIPRYPARARSAFL